MKVLLVFCLVIVGVISQHVPTVPTKQHSDDVVVKLNHGLLKGKTIPGNDHPYEAFLGVPYAKPPVGSLRFSNPVPCEPWGTIYDATYSRNECLQKFHFINQHYIKGEEDCLYLNIYRPCKRNPEKKLPVVVYLGIGGHGNDATSFEKVNPDYLMDTQEVIVVVVQSRVGPLGFLSSGDKHCQGNFGIKDQQLALRFVYENIGNFGGDCTCVTIMGAGGRAVAAQLHWLHPETSKYFQKVVLKSGSILSPQTLLHDPYEQFIDHAKHIGIKNPSSLSTYDITEKLRNCDAKVLLSICDNFDYWNLNKIMYYRPTIEGNWEGAYITKNPVQLWKQGKYEPKPLYYTLTQSDANVFATLLIDPHRRMAFNENFKVHLPEFLDIDPKHYPAVKDYYFKDDVCQVTDHNIFKFIDLFTVRLFQQAHYNTIKCHVNNVDTVKYPLSIDKFNFNGPNHFTKYLSGYEGNLNVGLFDDLLYLFRFPKFFPDFDRKSISYQMKDIYVNTHIHFFVNGVAKSWSQLDVCSGPYFDKFGFCEYQVFCNQTEYINNILHYQATVQPTNYYDLEGVKFWDTCAPLF
ncbi:hypothetical protein DMENIID0001_028420 [Sergentomyia squamirostris]